MQTTAPSLILTAGTAGGGGVQRHVDKHPARFASVVGERSKLNVKTNENKTWGLAVVLLPQTE